MATNARKNTSKKKNTVKSSRVSQAIKAGELNPSELGRWVRLGEVPKKQAY